MRKYMIEMILKLMMAVMASVWLISLLCGLAIFMLLAAVRVPMILIGAKPGPISYILAYEVSFLWTWSCQKPETTPFVRGFLINQ